MSKANILVVDDQDSIRHFVTKSLEDQGYAVRDCASIREAREALSQDLPDLAVLDLKLPDGSGIELLKEIKRIPMRKPTARVAPPFVFATAWRAPTIMSRAAWTARTASSS